MNSTTLCQITLIGYRRSYEAQITLDQAGIHNSYNLQGGMAALKKWGLDL